MNLSQYQEEEIEQIYRICQSTEFLKHVWKIHIREAYLGHKMLIMRDFDENQNTFIIGFIEVSKYKRRPIVHLRHMGVKEDYRRKGVMSALLHNAENSYGAYTLKVETRASNEPMNAFLKKHGFVFSGTKTVGNGILVNIYQKLPRTLEAYFKG